MHATTTPRPLSMTQILICGALIVTMSMGVRHGFGLWLQPMTTANGWTREHFSLAMAVQNLTWGFVGIGAGMLADRLGAVKVLMVGGLLYALGLVGMAYSTTPTMLALTCGVILGCAQACTTYAVIYGVIGRNVDPSKRSVAMGITAAAGSFGQFLMLPLEGFLITQTGWQLALLICALLALMILPLSLGLREPGFSGGKPAVPRSQTAGQAMREALTHPSFILLNLGYFVCGFQVVFIGVHMPSYLRDNGFNPQVASYALALIGLFNIFGTYLTGVLGQTYTKKYILAAIYTLRSIGIIIFLMTPLTATSVYIFSAYIGFLWLCTVPPTNALIAQMFGVGHLSMLGGTAFFSHQVGSFLGVWLGGLLYDKTGSYDIVWQLAIVLGVIASLLHLPIKERAIERAPVGAAA